MMKRLMCGSVFTLMVTVAVAPNTYAAIVGPYSADANTLHLWHLDEADPGPAAPASGVTGSFNLTPSGGASLGATSFTGFGTAGDTSGATAEGLQGSSIPVSSVTGAGGAFTMEAIIRTAETTSIQQIVSMDNSSSNPNRPFQFRMDGGNLRFINIAGGVQQILTAIPTTGDDAFVANQWFHVAVTYNGSENTADNLKFYWTRMDETQTVANQITGPFTMTSDLGGISTTFGVANEYRGSQDNNLEGFIDEVRISDIARTADDMMFIIPEPSTLLLTVVGLLGLLGCGRRRKR